MIRTAPVLRTVAAGVAMIAVTFGADRCITTEVIRGP